MSLVIIGKVSRLENIKGEIIMKRYSKKNVSDMVLRSFADEANYNEDLNTELAEDITFSFPVEQYVNCYGKLEEREEVISWYRYGNIRMNSLAYKLSTAANGRIKITGKAALTCNITPLEKHEYTDYLGETDFYYCEMTDGKDEVDVVIEFNLIAKGVGFKEDANESEYDFSCDIYV